MQGVRGGVRGDRVQSVVHRRVVEALAWWDGVCSIYRLKAAPVAVRVKVREQAGGRQGRVGTPSRVGHARKQDPLDGRVAAQALEIVGRIYVGRGVIVIVPPSVLDVLIIIGRH